jgi:hypothetical protein
MPNKRANVKNEKQYEALKDKGMSTTPMRTARPSTSSPRPATTTSTSTRSGRTRKGSWTSTRAKFSAWRFREPALD